MLCIDTISELISGWSNTRISEFNQSLFLLPKSCLILPSMASNDNNNDRMVNNLSKGLVYGRMIKIIKTSHGRRFCTANPIGVSPFDTHDSSIHHETEGAERYSEHGDHRNIVTIALIVCSGMTPISGFAQNYLQFLLARIGVAVGEAGGNPPSHSIICLYSQHLVRISLLDGGAYG